MVITIMVNEEKEFARYKSKLIYKTIANHFEKYFIDSSILPETALILFSEKINQESSFKESLVHLKEVLNESGILKYREQFRQFKYRSKSALKTIKVREETYNKIKTLSADYEGIDDLLFEYAFDERYHIDTTLIDSLPTGLTEEEQLKVLLQKVDYRVKNLIQLATQKAFEAGFTEGQTAKKIRSKKGLDQAIESLDYQYYQILND
jgi:hypothetical protein